MWAAYDQPKRLAVAVRQERVAIGGAPGFARAAHRLVCVFLLPARSFGGFPAVFRISGAGRSEAPMDRQVVCGWGLGVVDGWVRCL